KEEIRSSEPEVRVADDPRIGATAAKAAGGQLLSVARWTPGGTGAAVCPKGPSGRHYREAPPRPAFATHRRCCSSQPDSGNLLILSNAAIVQRRAEANCRAASQSSGACGKLSLSYYDST